MARGKRNFWWSIGFAVGFVVRDLMEEESSVRTGLKKLYSNACEFFETKCCCKKKDIEDPENAPEPEEEDIEDDES